MNRDDRRFATLITTGVALEVVGVIAFSYVAGAWPVPGKALVLVGFSVALLLLFAASIQHVSSKRRVLLVFILALGLVSTVELLGWTVFRGLRHDVRPFSPHHWRVFLGTALLGFVSFGGLMGLLSAGALLLSSTQKKPKSL